MTGLERQVLVLGSQALAAAVAGDIGGAEALTVRPAGASLPSATYDAVLLPSFSSTHGEKTAAPQAFPQSLHAAFRALVPGGMLVGHIEHGAALRSIARLGILAGSHRRSRLPWTGAGCQRALQNAGFVDAHCFFVEPSIDSPMALIPVQPFIARAHFLRAIHRTRDRYSLPGYLLRLALAQVRLGGMLQPHLFFWASRPC